MSTIINNRIEIVASPEAVWAVVADLERLDTYDPVVTTSTLLDGPTRGVGARRRCEVTAGRYFIDEVNLWEPVERLGFAVVECNLPTTGLTHTYTLRPTAKGTEIAQVMAYDMRFGPLGAVLNALMLRRKSDQQIKGFLDGLKTLVETNSVTDPDRSTNR